MLFVISFNGHTKFVAFNQWVFFFMKQSDLKIVADSGDLLNAFCNWQKKHDPPDQGDAKYPDVSILITKYVNKVNISLWWLADKTLT